MSSYNRFVLCFVLAHRGARPRLLARSSCNRFVLRFVFSHRGARPRLLARSSCNRFVLRSVLSHLAARTEIFGEVVLQSLCFFATYLKGFRVGMADTVGSAKAYRQSCWDHGLPATAC